MAPIKIRVISPWMTQLSTDTAFFSSEVPLEQADALLCDWSPSAELFSFPRRKAWYCCEPQSQFRDLGGGSWHSFRAQLAESEFLCHDNPDERYRVPHVTHFEPLVVNTRQDRKPSAVAVVSNHGGNPWRRHPGISFRNRFATHERVDLYGRESWRAYRPRRFSSRGAPPNYKGEIPGDWPASAKRDLLSTYRVAIALENMNETNYFTEKMVEAARAGCVPVYHPDSHSAAGVLAGAFWIDPGDYGNDPATTIHAALNQDLTMIQRQNATWFENNETLARSSHFEVFARIGEILSS